MSDEERPGRWFKPEVLDDPTKLIPWIEGLITNKLGGEDQHSYVPYINRDGVSALMNEAYGPLGWAFELTALNQDGETDKGSPKLAATAHIVVDGVAKTDVGTADGSDARKGAVSDAAKRTARWFGLGIWLGRLSKVQIKTVKRGRSTYPADGEEERAKKIWAEQLTQIGEDPAFITPSFVWLNQGGAARQSSSTSASTNDSSAPDDVLPSPRQTGFARRVWRDIPEERRHEIDDYMLKAGAPDEAVIAVTEWLGSNAEKWGQRDAPLWKAQVTELINFMKEIAEQEGASYGESS